MNRNDFRNPLIQSGILLVVVFIFISIVASAPADGFIAGIYALLLGLIKGLLFVIALSIGVIFSIAVLIGIFLLAASFHSVDKARTMWEHLKKSLASLYDKVKDSSISMWAKAKKLSVGDHQDPQSEKPLIPVKESDAQKQDPLRVETKLNTLGGQLNRLQTSFQAAEQQLATMQARLQEELASATNLEKRLGDLEVSSAELASAVKSQSKELVSTQTEISTFADFIRPEIDLLNREIAALHQKTSVPEVVSGILAYIDAQEDRETLTEKAEEAVSRGMTYAQTDEFFKKSLPAKVHKILSEHPRLTKDFIRSIKKKFE